MSFKNIACKRYSRKLIKFLFLLVNHSKNLDSKRWCLKLRANLLFFFTIRLHFLSPGVGCAYKWRSRGDGSIHTWPIFCCKSCSGQGCQCLEGQKCGLQDRRLRCRLLVFRVKCIVWILFCQESLLLFIKKGINPSFLPYAWLQATRSSPLSRW